MKQLLILSGKGGTGKTTTAAAFVRFSHAQAMADCDVDAPNLHLVSDLTKVPQCTDFIGSDKAKINENLCQSCGLCQTHCRFNAIEEKDGVYTVNEYACEGCGVCEYVCPCQAVTMEKDVAGQQMLYLEKGVFSTAKLKMGRGNSGKLVSSVKTNMLRHAKENDLAIVDGSPGIGCPVIASMGGADMVLIVAEPSLSGISDLERLVATAKGFGMKIAVCVNKWDAGKENTARIEDFCKENNLPFAGKIPYDKQASKAINQGLSLADVPCKARDALYQVFLNTMALLEVKVS